MSLPQEVASLYKELYNRVEGLRAGKPGVGHTFWVNGQNGSDTLWDGLRPTNTHDAPRSGPFATVTAALTHCTSYADDYILVLRGGGESYPVAIDVDRVHIIGITNPGAPQTVGGYLAGAHSCFTIDARHVEIAGLMLFGDADNPSIELLGQCWGLWVHHCSFGVTAATQDGIVAAVEAPVGGLIEHNIFGETIARDGCRLANATHCVIRHNIFMGSAGVAINVTNPAEIFGNRIVGHNVQGDCITVAGAGGIVAHNWAGYLDADAIGYEPFVDNGTNHWVDNVGNAVVMGPA